jgi:hypothetical protein
MLRPSSFRSLFNTTTSKTSAYLTHHNNPNSLLQFSPAVYKASLRFFRGNDRKTLEEVNRTLKKYPNNNVEDIYDVPEADEISIHNPDRMKELEEKYKW